MSSRVEFLYLSQEDVLATGIDMPKSIDIVERVLALHDEGKVDIYSKEVAARLSLAKVFNSFVVAVNANLAKW